MSLLETVLYRKVNNIIKSNTHQNITHRSFKKMMKTNLPVNCKKYLGKQSNIYDVDEIVEVWNKMFLEVVNKHAP